MTTSLAGRLSERVLVEHNGCWRWTGALTTAGYGTLRIGKKRSVYAHRVAYVLREGLIPAKLVIDHLCRNPACINPDHLEAVTHRENVRRGLRGSLITHCPHGHEYTPDNTYITKQGHRSCRACAKRRLVNRPPVTHCYRGHAYDAENTYVDTKRKRRCRACRRTLDRLKSERGLAS